ncbi:nuclear pore protein [Scheffersomyces coipomensis]|uniref:nuclear pore protein n=1 Tax=Scheffersomyces coipomensis TaxID=1788519 RepID=UPI00315DBA97
MTVSFYSVSNVVGYKQHLPTQVITLPLQYSPTATTTTSTKTEIIPSEEFHNKLSNTGNIINLSHTKSYIDHISYDLLNDSKTITLTPINSKPNNFDFKFQNISIQLPHSIISPKCLCITLNQDGQDDGNSHLIIDLIDESYLFITLRIALDDFIITESSKFKFLLNNFKKWGNISVPYSFELRSNPYLLKSIDSSNLIVSLKDGGLLHFKRNGSKSILSDFEVYNFTESVSMLPLNIFGGLFGGDKNKKSDVRKEITLAGISSNSIVDTIKLSSSVIATLTVSKTVKLWSLKNHQLINDSIIHLTEIQDISSWLTSIPTKYLQVLSNQNDDQSLLLTLYYTTNSDKEIESDNKSRFVFKSWNFNVDNTDLNTVEPLSFQPELPSSLLNNNNNNLWFIQDYQTQFINDQVKYHVLWKSNTSSVFVTYIINSISGAVSSINWSNDSEDKAFQEFSPIHTNDYYSNMILNSGRYDLLTVSTSLNLVRNHLGLEFIDFNNHNHSIRQLINDTFNNAKKNIQDHKFYWFQLALLCEEFKKSSEEALSLSLTKEDNNYLVLQVNGLGLIRPSHYYESFQFESPETPEGQLVEILTQLNKLISIKTYTKIQNRIKNITTITETEIEEFDGYIGSKLSQSEVVNLMEKLASIPKVIDLINLLIDGSLEDFENIDTNALNYNYKDSNHLSIIKRLFTIISFKNIKNEHEIILLNLLILFIICDTNDEILVLLNKIIKKLKSYNLIEFIFDTSFSSTSTSLETNDLNSIENSLFWSGIVDKDVKLNSLISTKSTFNESFDYYFGQLFTENNEEIMVDVILDLLNRNEGAFIKQSFFKQLKMSRNIDRFLIGLIYLINNEVDEFYQIFKTFEAFEFNKFGAREQDKIYKSLSKVDNIKLFLESVFTKEEETNQTLKKSNYFHSLSELSKSQANVLKYQQSSKTTKVETDLINVAIDFEKMAIENLKTVTDQLLHQNRLNEYYINLFELSLIISNYDQCYESLNNLQIESSKYQELFKRYIIKLITNQSISKLFPSSTNENTLYVKNYLLIDEILISLANNERLLSNSLKLYQYVYSWRLFGSSKQLTYDQLSDKRGSIEALYYFISRFKQQQLIINSNEDVKQFKLKVLELYIIIINCLKSFEDNDDKWLLKVNPQSSKDNQIITLDELKIEYYEWLRELELEVNVII